jgi:predicted HTH transcriptional regulator
MIPLEGQTVELKESLGLWREIVATCAAFASAQGGRIYVGVRDDGTAISGAARPETSGMSFRVIQ